MEDIETLERTRLSMLAYLRAFTQIPQRAGPKPITDLTPLAPRGMLHRRRLGSSNGLRGREAGEIRRDQAKGG